MINQRKKKKKKKKDEPRNNKEIIIPKYHLSYDLQQLKLNCKEVLKLTLQEFKDIAKTYSLGDSNAILSEVFNRLKEDWNLKTIKVFKKIKNNDGFIEKEFSIESGTMISQYIVEWEGEEKLSNPLNETKSTNASFSQV